MPSRAEFKSTASRTLLSDIEIQTREKPTYELSKGTLYAVLWPDTPRLEIWTDGGKHCVLLGEDIGILTRWLSERGYPAP